MNRGLNAFAQSIDPHQPEHSTEADIPIKGHLALSQTTNFRLFQTERVCRRQF